MSETPDLKRIIQCGLTDAVEAIGERWSFLILRGAFNGLVHFEEFQQTLGIARNILANRLARLVEKGILDRSPSAEDRRRVNYRLTDKGEALLPVLVALRQWGHTWGEAPGCGPVLIDLRDGKPLRDMRVEAHDGRPVRIGDLSWFEPGPEAAVVDADAPGSSRPEPQEAQAAENHS
ncbi:helix-turn-helix domain-containing protein [Sphingomonas naphthae]|uniref:Helix-turn-helix domain-containing protein n=1 Tax=Sphingomonas naphthae TaxID=1813468 RepID=A0ABY7TL38_9SPHN|nr:helix-turn-helix domain-containing protein [Sphingomonas naphthae]WCT73879.1 helix-turn-helix domain-containing protein [Sphingomonas naphthae]